MITRPQHALRMATYNAPLYGVIAVAICASLLGGAVAPNMGVRIFSLAITVGATWFGLASFGAFYWLFDQSPLLDGRWINEFAPSPDRWVQVSVFLEETTLPLHSVWRGTGRDLDLYHPDVMTESAVNRAKGASHTSGPERTAPDALPIADGWSQATVVTLVAHEIRSEEQRHQFFAELARITAADGRIILVEHTRNLAALMAYGPGWWHFLPDREWMDRSRASGLDVIETKHITPFVKVFVLGHG